MEMNREWKARSHGLVVKQMAHDQKVVGSNPGTILKMDVSDLLAITLKKNWKIKAAKWGTPIDIYIYIYIYIYIIIKRIRELRQK